MPLFDHIGELRRRLTIVVVSLLAAALVFYFATPTVIDVLKDPILPYTSGDFIITGALNGFSLRFGVSIKIGLVVVSPLIVWQVLGFFLPALRPKERRWAVPTVILAAVLFYAGIVFCYFFIVPPAFEFLVGESSAIATVMPEASDFINTELMLMIGFGVAFELPLLVFYLAVFHVVPYASFRAAWRYIYVILLVVSAGVTPDASPVTMLLMYAVVMVLYEASLFVTRIVIVQREGKEGLKRRSFLADDGDE